MNPAHQLVGHTLPGGWLVVDRLERVAGATGGFSSVQYIAEKPSGERAFVKAIDLHDALKADNKLAELARLSQAVLFEKSVFEVCRSKRMRRVVSPIDAGKIKVNDSLLGEVDYLLFELADKDLRNAVDSLAYRDHAWIFRALHHVTTGLHQLHLGAIAHQDVKPSNVVYFDSVGAKVADLGRASVRGQSSPHEEYRIAGDEAYAPPELLYSYLHPEWTIRRLGCDAYLLGSLIVFLFGNTSMTALLSSHMPSSHHWSRWRDGYSQVLPYLTDAFGTALSTFAHEAGLWDRFSGDVLRIIRELCNPDIERRGHPLSRANTGNPLSLERYVSEFDLLATRAEIGA